MMSSRSVLFFKPKTAYAMRSSDWRSDRCSSDRSFVAAPHRAGAGLIAQRPLRGELVRREETGGLGGGRHGGVVVTSAPCGPRISLGSLDLWLFAAHADSIGPRRSADIRGWY